MYKTPLVLGIDSQRLAINGISVADTLAHSGNNTGNILFSESLYNVLHNARRGNYYFTDHDLEGCDAIVIAAANWLNPYSDFDDLTTRLEKTKLPIYIVGLGAQSASSKEIPTLKDGTMRLVQLIADRSCVLSARGDFTCEVLMFYNVKNVIATGCPSLMLCGSGVPNIRKALNITPSDCAVQSTRHLFNATGDLQKYLYREAIRLKIDIILQSELADIYYAIGSVISSEIDAKADGVFSKIYKGSTVEEVKWYLKHHGKVFFSLDQWTSYIKTKKFCFGTRIHGTIAALIAGTPATLIAHDSRTLELAQKMTIPYIEADKIDVTAGVKISELYLTTMIDDFQKSYRHYYTKFLEFFRLNNIQVRKEYQIGFNGTFSPAKAYPSGSGTAHISD